MKVSVIVPIFNVGSYVYQCVSSITNQTYKNIEIILVIDGSEDDSALTCYSLAKKDKRIKVIEKDNGGLVSARKEGLKHATGNYILNIDGDDWISEDCIEKLVNNSSNGTADIVIPGYLREFVGNNEKIPTNIKPGIYKEIDIQNEVLPNMISNDNFFSHGVSTFSWGKLFKYDLLYKIQMEVPDQITLGEDSVVTYPCIAFSKKISIVDEYLYFYRQRASSMLKMTKKSSVEIKNIIFMINFLIKQLKKSSNYDFSDQIQNYLVALSIIRTGGFLDNNDFIDGIFKNISIKEKKTVLYSSGAFGQQMYKQMNSNSYNLVGWIDEDCFESKAQGLKVLPTYKIKDLNPELVIVATLDETYFNEILCKIKDFIGDNCTVVFPTLSKKHIEHYSKNLLNE